MRNGVIIGLVLGLSGGAAWADKPAQPKKASDQPAATAPAEEPFKWSPGPASIDLGHDLKIDLPAEDVYLDAAQGQKLLAKMGHFHEESLVGIIAAKDEKQQWFVTLNYLEEGYVKDDDKINADELLKTFKEGQEEANKERAEKGFSPLYLDGWSEAPHYDKAKRHLIWGLKVRGSHGTSINYNTRILGRKGHVSLDLVTAPETLTQDLQTANALLNGTNFKTGARYEDFKKGTDKVAEYGLVGLIAAGAGVAALKVAKGGFLILLFKKLGFILLAAKKFIVLAFAAVATFFKKLFGKKDPPPPAAT